MFFLAQLNPRIGDLTYNRLKIEEMISSSRREGASWVVTSEMALTGYPPLDLLLIPSFMEEVEKSIEVLRKSTEGITLFLGAPRVAKESFGQVLYNSCFIIQDKQIVAVYDKRLLPNYDVFDERRYFEPGKTPQVVTIDNKKVLVTICEDLWGDTISYPEDPLAPYANGEVDLIINLSASPYHLGKIEERLAVGRRAVKLVKAPLLLCNQVGGQDGLLFDGSSYFLDEKGDLIEMLPFFEECGKRVDREKREPLRLDRGQELIKALSTGITDYVKKLGFQQVILGLSGGIDSAVVAVLASRALGPSRVKAILMPSKFSSEGSVKDSEALIENLSIGKLILPIHKPHEVFLDILEPHFQHLPPDVTEENIQARIRGNLLMALSNKWGSLVLNTGNKSELAMGYATLYGDMCGALAVIGDLTKTQVYQLASWLNEEEELIPRSILEKAPSAELRPNQKDSDSLPPYSLLDRVIACYMEENLSEEEIARREDIDLDLVKSLIRKIHLNEYKRRQGAPILRVSKKAFCLGYHLPIVQSWQK